MNERQIRELIRDEVRAVVTGSLETSVAGANESVGRSKELIDSLRASIVLMNESCERMTKFTENLFALWQKDRAELERLQGERRS